MTPKATRAAEVAGYSHYEDAFEALELLKGLCPVVPVHSVVGTVQDRV